MNRLPRIPEHVSDAARIESNKQETEERHSEGLERREQTVVQNETPIISILREMTEIEHLRDKISII